MATLEISWYRSVQARQSVNSVSGTAASRGWSVVSLVPGGDVRRCFVVGEKFVVGRESMAYERTEGIWSVARACVCACF